MHKAGLVSALTDVGGRLSYDVVQLVSVVRQIAIKTCVVLLAGLLTSVAAFVVLRRLEPDVPVAIAVADAGEDSPGPRPTQGGDEPVTGTVASGSCGSGDCRAADTVIADRTYCIDVKMSNRMPFSETHV